MLRVSRSKGDVRALVKLASAQLLYVHYGGRQHITVKVYDRKGGGLRSSWNHQTTKSCVAAATPGRCTRPGQSLGEARFLCRDKTCTHVLNVPLCRAVRLPRDEREPVYPRCSLQECHPPPRQSPLLSAQDTDQTALCLQISAVLRTRLLYEVFIYVRRQLWRTTRAQE